VINIKEAKNLLLIAIILMAISFLSACQRQPLPGGDNDSTQLADPSATYCVEQGNSYLIKTAGDGSQSGICILQDGTACDSWAYYRNECGAAGNATAPAKQNKSEPGAGNPPPGPDIPIGNSSHPVSNLSCSSDSDCTPAQCCHATTCINLASKRVCNLLCTQECRPGTLDCGQGGCRCVAGNCEAVMQ
jgi:putative hemolysin